MLSCRTKFGGNRKISEERLRAPQSEVPPVLEKEVRLLFLAPEEGISGFRLAENSGSARHSNGGKTLAQLETAIVFFLVLV